MSPTLCRRGDLPPVDSGAGQHKVWGPTPGPPPAGSPPHQGQAGHTHSLRQWSRISRITRDDFPESVWGKKPVFSIIEAISSTGPKKTVINRPLRTGQIQLKLYRQSITSIPCAACPSFKSTSRESKKLSVHKVGYSGDPTSIWSLPCSYPSPYPRLSSSPTWAGTTTVPSSRTGYWPHSTSTWHSPPPSPGTSATYFILWPKLSGIFVWTDRVYWDQIHQCRAAMTKTKVINMNLWRCYKSDPALPARSYKP